VSQSSALFRRQRNQGRQSRGSRGAWRKKGDELICGLICKFRERQGPYCKGLATFNQCSNEDGPKSKSAWFFKLYNFSLRFICI
jgi:hypothetical protein